MRAGPGRLNNRQGPEFVRKWASDGSGLPGLAVYVSEFECLSGQQRCRFERLQICILHGAIRAGRLARPCWLVAVSLGLTNAGARLSFWLPWSYSALYAKAPCYVRVASGWPCICTRQHQPTPRRCQLPCTTPTVSTNHQTHHHHTHRVHTQEDVRPSGASAPASANHYCAMRTTRGVQGGRNCILL